MGIQKGADISSLFVGDTTSQPTFVSLSVQGLKNVKNLESMSASAEIMVSGSFLHSV